MQVDVLCSFPPHLAHRQGPWFSSRAGAFSFCGVTNQREEEERVPPKHRPTPPIHKSLEFLVHPWWMPFVLFWVAVFAIFYVTTLLA